MRHSISGSRNEAVLATDIKHKPITVVISGAFGKKEKKKPR
jgi:hypothetical protein